MISLTLSNLDNLRIEVDSHHFTLMLDKMEHHAARKLTIKIVGVGASKALSTRPLMSLPYVVAGGAGYLGELLAVNLTEGVKTKVKQLETDLNDLTELIEQIIAVEIRAQRFINAKTTFSGDTWYEK